MNGVKANSDEEHLGREKLISLGLEEGLSAGQQMAAVNEFSAPTPVFLHCCHGPINLKSWALIGQQTLECNTD